MLIPISLIEQTELSQISNYIEAKSQRLSEQNNNKLTQIEQYLNNKFKEILKESRKKDNDLVNDEEDAEKNKPSTSKPDSKLLRRNHTSNTEINKDKNQDNRFQSETYEVRQPSTPFGVVIETLDDTIIISENRQRTDYHIPYSHIFQFTLESLVKILFLLASHKPFEVLDGNLGKSLSKSVK